MKMFRKRSSSSEEFQETTKKANGMRVVFKK